jgi:hypothetical protein
LINDIQQKDADQNKAQQNDVEQKNAQQNDTTMVLVRTTFNFQMPPQHFTK